VNIRGTGARASAKLAWAKAKVVPALIEPDGVEADRTKAAGEHLGRWFLIVQSSWGNR
jgi:murein tripeptide amidase MpaA